MVSFTHIGFLAIECRKKIEETKKNDKLRNYFVCVLSFPYTSTYNPVKFYKKKHKKCVHAYLIFHYSLVIKKADENIYKSTSKKQKFTLKLDKGRMI